MNTISLIEEASQIINSKLNEGEKLSSLKKTITQSINITDLKAVSLAATEGREIKIPAIVEVINTIFDDSSLSIADKKSLFAHKVETESRMIGSYLPSSGDVSGFDVMASFVQKQLPLEKQFFNCFEIISGFVSFNSSKFAKIQEIYAYSPNVVYSVNMLASFGSKIATSMNQEGMSHLQPRDYSLNKGILASIFNTISKVSLAIFESVVDTQNVNTNALVWFESTNRMTAIAC